MFKRNGRMKLYIEAAGVTAGFLLIVVLVFRAWSISRDDQVVEPGISLKGLQIFPLDDPWNTDISGKPVDENSDVLIAAIGLDSPLHPDFGTKHNGVPVGIPYTVVPADQPKVPVTFEYASESDPGPYPIPPNVLIEGGPQSMGDRHVILIDRTNRILYELYAAIPQDDGKSWHAGSGAIFDLTRPSMQRPIGWTSADAAGLPIFAGLVRYDEVVEQGRIPHALRFTVRRTRRAFVPPATRYASRDTNPNLPPMGMRVRLKRNYDISSFPPSARVILECLKTYGMILADNGGDWFISGAPDPRWNDDDLQTLKKITGSAFEVVRMSEIRTTIKPIPATVMPSPGK